MSSSILTQKVKDYANCTSCHGLSAAILSRGVAKLVWISIFLTALGFCTYQIVMIFIYYFGYPVQYKVKLDYGQLDFPAVTICNWNPYMTSKIKQNKDLNAVITYMSGLSAGTIEPPNRPSRKRRATEWANKVIQNHILTETGDREIHSNPIIISDSTRSQFILEAAKYLVDNMPEGAEFFEQKRNALRTIVRLKAFDNGDSIAQGLTNSKEFLKTSGQPTNTGMKEKQVIETNLSSVKMISDKSDKNRIKRAATSCCSPNCYLDSLSQNCYTPPSSSYSYSAANTYCSSTIGNGARVPSFSSATAYSNFKVVKDSQSPATNMWMGYYNNASHSNANPGTWSSQSGNWGNYASWASNEPSGNANENCMTIKGSSASVMDVNCNLACAIMCQCSYCCLPFSAAGTTVTYNPAPPAFLNVGNTATITCQPGYTLVGVSPVNCLSTGVWSSTTYCRPPCAAVSPSAGVWITYSNPNIPVGSYLTWGCNPGYTPVYATGNINCVASGTNSVWDPVQPTPTCRPPCIGYPMPSTGYTSVTYSTTAVTAANGTKLYVYNTVATITCQSFSPVVTTTFFNASNNASWSVSSAGTAGYTVVGSASNSVSCINGVWNPAAACSIQCPEFTTADINDSLQINYTSNNFGIRTVGSQMILDCKPGYARLSAITCLANGSWDVEPTCALVCKPYEVMCTNGTATTLLHANITYTDTFKVIYSYANITCHQGYAVPDENIQIQCLPTAENNDTYWNRCPPPVCERQCPDLAPLANSSDPADLVNSKPFPTYTPSSRTANSTLTWQCGYSYVPSGNPLNVTCYSDSILSTNWSNTAIPYCFYLPPAVIDMILAADFKTMTPGETQSLLDDILLYYITTLDPLTMASLGGSVTDMVKFCTYDNVPCDMKNDFKLALDPTLGNCYRYNDDIPVKYKTNQPGPNRGLRMMLAATQSEYISKTSRAGYLAIFHTQKDTVFADVSGYSIAPGQRTNFALAYKRLERLNAPYDTCTNDGGGLIFYYSTAYSQDGCWRSCLQHLIIKYCGCGDPRMPIPSGGKYCTTLQKECINGVTGTTGATQLVRNCSCPTKCRDVSYAVAISMSKYPAVSPMSTVYSCTPGSSRYSCHEDIQANNSLVYIYYGDMSYILITENPAYPILKLVIDIGSNAGLCLGMSAITIVELLKLLGEIVVTSMWAQKKISSVAQQPDQKKN